jgi:hypothetical protein
MEVIKTNPFAVQHKNMPRQARLDAPGVLQHVMARGIERRKIFKDNKDRKVQEVGDRKPEVRKHSGIVLGL